MDDIGESQFNAEVIEASRSGPVMVEFGASWCAPCRALKPQLEAFVATQPGLKLVSVDIDRAPGVASTHAIRGVPVVVVFRDGKVAKRHTGGVPDAAKLRALLAV